MRVLVYPNNLRVGGSQFTAVDLAGAMRARGHDVFLIAQDGPLRDRAQQAGVRVIVSPRLEERTLSLASVRTLARVVRQHRIELVHAYEAVPCLQALYATRMGRRAAVVGTIMSARVPWYLPSWMPLAVGVPRKVADFRRRWATEMITLVPPAVDTTEYQPRPAARPNDAALRLVLVTRVARSFKFAPLSLALEAVDELASAYDVRLTIVGDGPELPRIRERVKGINAAHAREVVTLAGELPDPVASYVEADVVLGSGLSLIRGMACGKPCIVLGRDGFAETVDSDTIDKLAHWGFYGRGDNQSVDVLVAELRSLLDDESKRVELGHTARALACERFSMEKRARVLEPLYHEHATGRVPRARPAMDMLLTFVRKARYRRQELRLKREAAAVGHVGDRADAYVYFALAERFARRPAPTRSR